MKQVRYRAELSLYSNDCGCLYWFLAKLTSWSDAHSEPVPESFGVAWSWNISNSQQVIYFSAVWTVCRFLVARGEASRKVRSRPGPEGNIWGGEVGLWKWKCPNLWWMGLGREWPESPWLIQEWVARGYTKIALWCFASLPIIVQFKNYAFALRGKWS